MRDGSHRTGPCATRELTVGELVARLDEVQPKVSNHLARLRRCGFVATRREHRAVYNRTADEPGARGRESGPRLARPPLLSRGLGGVPARIAH